MNYAMVRILILKDWYFQRLALLLSLVGGVLSLGIIAFGGRAGFTVGVILVVMTIVMVSAITVMGNTIEEREKQTLAFVMSLPISYLEFTTSKIVGNLLIFAPIWLALVAGSLGLIVMAPQIHGFFAFSVIMAIEILVSTCLMMAVALVTESKNWTITAMVVGNVALNLVGYVVAHVPAIRNGMWGTAIYWNSTATAWVVAEVGLIALLLGGTFFIQSRKKDFV